MRPLILILVVQAYGVALTQAQSPNMIGRWNVEITFPNGDNRSLRFEAQGAGKGSFLLLDPRSNFWEPARPSEAKWTQGAGNSVTFSGAAEFPIGNVGRDAGTLVFKGKFETESLIAGDVEFSPLVGDGPSKNGTFKAIRAAGGNSDESSMLAGIVDPTVPKKPKKACYLFHDSINPENSAPKKYKKC